MCSADDGVAVGCGGVVASIVLMRGVAVGVKGGGVEVLVAEEAGEGLQLTRSATPRTRAIRERRQKNEFILFAKV